MEIIIQSWTDTDKIGQIVTGPITDRNRQWHDATFRLARRATKQEYINFCRKEGVPENELVFDGTEYYYAILMD